MEETKRENLLNQLTNTSYYLREKQQNTNKAAQEE